MHVSASQIETYKMCYRKWGFRYLDGIYAPSTPAAEYGKEGHGVVEHYLGTGKLEGADDIIPLLKKAIKQGFLPEPGEELLLEQKFQMPVLGMKKDTFLGYIDCLVPGDVPLIIDHKFTKNHCYAKSVEQLTDNVQAVLYSAVGFWLYPEVEKLVTRWIYYEAPGATRPRKIGSIRKVEVERTREDTKRRMLPILETARDILKLRRMNKKAMDLAEELTACAAFGGCPHYGVCQKDATPKTRFIAIMKQARFVEPKNKEKDVPRKSLLEKLKARQEKDGATEVNPEPETKEEKSSAKSKLDKIRAKKEEKAAEEPKKKKKEEKAPEPKKEEKAPEEPKEEEKAAEEPKEEKKRGRPRGSKNKMGTGHAQFVLLLNAAVTKGLLVTPLSELLRPVLKRVSEDTEKAHWALLEFGQGKGYLATAMDDHLTETGWKGTLQVETNSPEARAVLEVLIAHADVVVRGYA